MYSFLKFNIMLRDAYGMITPNDNSCEHYNQFYNFYSLHIKYNMIINHLLKEHASELPLYGLDFYYGVNSEIKKLNIFGFAELDLTNDKRDNFQISISNIDKEIYEKYFNRKYDKFLDYITNIQQILLLYTNFEVSIANHLNLNDNEKSVKLIDGILKIDGFIEKFEDTYVSFGQNVNESKRIFKLIWRYFTNIRNLFAHTYGQIGGKFKDKYTRLSKRMRMLLQIDKEFEIFSENIDDKLYIINEAELKFFRNFIIYIWETIYLLKNNKPNLKQLNNKYNINFYKEPIFDTKNNIKANMVFPTLADSLNNFKLAGDLKNLNSELSLKTCCKCHRDLCCALYEINIVEEFYLNSLSGKTEDMQKRICKIQTCPNCQVLYLYIQSEKGVVYTSDKIDIDTYANLLSYLNNNI